MIDPDLKYCPKCNDEYRAEIVQCASCGIDLLSGAELLDAQSKQNAHRNNRLGALTADDEVVSIHQGSGSELTVFEKLLQQENIGAMIVDKSQGCGKGCCGTTLDLMVRKEDAQDAYHLVQASLDQTRALDDHDLSCCDTVVNMDAGEAICPACGFTFQTSTSTCPDCGLCFG
jgi:uncharacterized protein (UPF0212 family)